MGLEEFISREINELLDKLPLGASHRTTGNLDFNIKKEYLY